MLYSFLSRLRSPRFALVAAVIVVAVSVSAWCILVRVQNAQTKSDNFSNSSFLNPTKPAPFVEAPESLQASIQRAKTLRKQGRDTEALSLLGPLNDITANESLWLEQGELAFDQARYEDARNDLAKIGLAAPSDFREMLKQGFQFMVERQPNKGEPLFQKAQLGALVLAYSGKRAEADEVFAETLQRIARLRRINDLTHRIAASANRPEIVTERSSLLASESNPTVSKPAETEPGRMLYMEKCSHCHGEKGAGNGRAARHLFPLPRNFAGQRFRYVSASNGLACDDDLIRVIRTGLPGSAMPAFPDLSEQDLMLLLPVVREFHRNGVETRLKGLSSSKQELDDLVLARTQPSEQLQLPKPLYDTMAVHRGELLFTSTGCSQCHNATISQQQLSGRRLFDESGQPILARNFSTDPLKGGRTMDQVYFRLALGIPGTPHPSFSGSPSETLDLACYVLSIAVEENTMSTNSMRRARLSESND